MKEFSKNKFKIIPGRTQIKVTILNKTKGFFLSLIYPKIGPINTYYGPKNTSCVNHEHDWEIKQ